MPLTRVAFVALSLLSAVSAAASANLSPDEFRRELVDVPLCGTPTTGALAGKTLCTLHLTDGTAVVAGAGILVRGLWQVTDGRICRRNAHEPPERQHCVDYERLSPERYKNSDGVEFCIGPCPEPAARPQ
jgi:hypothetical protein